MRGMQRTLLWVGLSSALALGCAADFEAPGAGEGGPSSAADEDFAATQQALAEAPQPSAAVQQHISRRRGVPRAALDQVHELHHYVPIGQGRRLHVTERFTVRSWLRWPHRGAVLLPGTVVTGSFYDIDVDGYRFAEQLAREGFFAFAIDYEGTGESTYPADGNEATHEYLVDSVRRALPYLRVVRLIARLDLIGESNGGAIAAELCEDDRRVRSCVLASMLFAEPTPFLEAVFLDPAFLAFIQSQPDGYLDATPDFYFNITARMSPDVAAEVLATQPGLYAVPPLLEPTTLPWFDPSQARVPALILQGTEDNIALQSDSDLLAAAYGSASGVDPETTVVRIAGGGHIPRVEEATREAWTDAVLEFLTP